MAEMISCKICGRFFEPNSFLNICSICKTRDDEIYGKLRDYLIQNPRSKIYDVSKLLDIPVYHIRRYLREERLEIVEKDNSFLTCEKCGKPLRSGRFCNDCRVEAKNSAAFAEAAQGHRNSQMPVEQTEKDANQRIKYISGNNDKLKRVSI